MNELKFRAWDEDAGCFAYSDQETDYYVWGFEDGKLKAWAINETCGTIDEPPDHECVEIEEPEQYIGLKDKNGKEIYKGDIVSYTSVHLDHSRYFKIVFAEGMFCQIEITPHGYIEKGREADLWIDWEEIEIIGNVHENPELLEGK